jgi:hypothetical protein
MCADTLKIWSNFYKTTSKSIAELVTCILYRIVAHCVSYTPSENDCNIVIDNIRDKAASGFQLGQD